MSLQSIEIEAFSGPTSVLIGGGNQPTIVYINQGPAGAAGGTWGSITGTLSSQTDLQTALNLKAPLASPTFTGIVTAPRIEGKCAGLELFCKAGQAINAGKVVYVTGSSGTNIIIGLAQANAELTSSKTIGICESTLAHNATGYVITEGLMTVSISAPTAAVGDPIWLSGTTAGGMLFGAANKPAYPYHIVYLGVVTRKTGNTIVEMYVKVQNGLEIDELSDVLITTPLANQALVRNSDKWINRYLLSSDISDLAAALPNDYEITSAYGRRLIASLKTVWPVNSNLAGILYFATTKVAAGTFTVRTTTGYARVIDHRGILAAQVGTGNAAADISIALPQANVGQRAYAVISVNNAGTTRGGDITRLTTTSNEVTVIDVASTTALTYLLCYGNQLTELNVSANTALTILDCNTNQLTALDIGTNVLLTICNASTNQLTTVAADEILVDLNALNVAGTLVNVAGTGNSPVSATGVAAAAGLLADGWATVSYNV
jgi:hypothetical protein